MKKLLFLLTLVITLVSCSSTSGKLEPKSRVETAIEQKKLVKFRAKEVWFSNVIMSYHASNDVILLNLDALYRVGDTVEIVDKYELNHTYVLID